MIILDAIVVVYAIFYIANVTRDDLAVDLIDTVILALTFGGAMYGLRWLLK
jgi:hypothetical protein